MEIYRTFLGIPLKVGAGFLEGRDWLIHHLKDERISWVDPGLYHVTIRFLGDTPVSLAGEISHLMGQMQCIPAVTRIGITGPGSFGWARWPKVVWTGFRQEDFFISLHRSMNALLEEAGIQSPDQPFRPHLTLGRIRSLRDPERFHRELELVKDHFKGEVKADRLVYYRSIHGKDGPRYEPLHTIEFRN